MIITLFAVQRKLEKKEHTHPRVTFITIYTPPLFFYHCIVVDDPNVTEKGEAYFWTRSAVSELQLHLTS